MKSLQLAALMAALSVTTLASAASQTLYLSAPSTTEAFGQSASAAADAPLPVSFAAEAGTTFSSFSWWGYHTPDSNGANTFELVLNGAAVGGPVAAEATGSLLPDPAGGTDTAMLMRYTVDLAGTPALTGPNEFSVLNSDLGAVWWWQGTGTGTDPFQPAWSLTGMTQPIPEPQTAALMLAGLLLAGGVLQRRKRLPATGSGLPR
jgi:hypothetical protein